MPLMPDRVGYSDRAPRWPFVLGILILILILAPDQSDASVTLPINARGEADKVDAVAKPFLQLFATDTRNYQAEIYGLDYPAFLEPARLAKQGGLQFAHKQLVTAIAVTEKYKLLTETRIASLHQAIQNADISPETRQKMLVGLELPSESHSKHVFELQEEMLRKYDAIISLLIHPHGHWEVVDGKFAFSSEADVKAFSAIEEDINQLQAEATSFRQQTLRPIDTQPPPE